ncbi:MAG: MoaD/ThiS family protein [Aigarchaeota archaeon]|nr:MoaD/ThiS family protein [Aigarchaeota archaeon]MDW8092714.1 MoaD/ThiS family protein [Nitrososphaerota archaeon]
MKIELFGHLRYELKATSIEVRVDGKVSLKDLLKALPSPLREQLLDEYGSIKPNVMILVNDVDARTVYNYEILVSDSDRIALVPMIHGGINSHV